MDARLRTLVVTLVTWLAWAAAAAACPICFQVEDGSIRDGVQAGVLVLVALTALVLGGVIRFAWRLIGK